MTKISQLLSEKIILYDIQITLLLSLALVVISPYSMGLTFWTHYLLVGMFVLYLSSPRCRNSPYIWFAGLIVLSFVLIREWHFADNHKYLILYWFLACALSFGNEQEENLRVNSRRLIGLAFLAATIWKLTSVEFISGNFFHGAYQVGGHFREFAALVSGLDIEHLKNNSVAFENFIRSGSIGDELTILESSTLRVLGCLTTAWVIFIESFLAAAFLMTGRWAQKSRDLALICFIATTYLVTPVELFGLTLSVLGFAQVEKKRINLKLIYLAFYFLVQVAGMMQDFYAYLAMILY